MELVIFLIMGTFFMMATMFICRRWYRYLWWKIVILSILLTLGGVLGVKLLFFLENGSFSGLSYYGAVLLVPVFFVFTKFLIHMPYKDLMDLCAPSECVMLALMKVQCLTSGCCKGRVLYLNAAGEEVRFPSQITELCIALLIMVFLIVLMSGGELRGGIYPVYMITYGVTRFVLNWFRETETFIWKLPAGNFWSLVAIGIGVVWLIILSRRKHKIMAFEL